MQDEDISNHGWTIDGEIDWVKESFPDDIQAIAILVNENRDNDDIYSDLENEETRRATVKMKAVTMIK